VTVQRSGSARGRCAGIARALGSYPSAAGERPSGIDAGEQRIGDEWFLDEDGRFVARSGFE
jgi:hypothetical protein